MVAWMYWVAAWVSPAEPPSPRACCAAFCPACAGSEAPPWRRAEVVSAGEPPAWVRLIRSWFV
jgi:hypothetical protein